MFPDDLTTVNTSGLTPDAACYRRGWTLNGWTVDRVGAKGYTLLAPTHTGEDKPICSILTLPAMTIDENTWMSWEGLSLMADFPESYRVLVKAGDDEAEEILSVPAENSVWTPRLVSLARFAGQNCSVMIECNSVNGYLLAVSGLRVGAPGQGKFAVENRTPQFGTLAGTHIAGTLHNIGAEADYSALVCRDGDAAEIGRLDLSAPLATDSRTDFDFLAPAVKDTRSAYTLSLEKDGAEPLEVASGSFYSSDFARTLLVDKATGMWCNNCPAANILVDDLEAKYGSQVAMVETHVQTNDKLNNMPYWDELHFFSVPSLMLNRIKSTGGGNLEKFDGHYDAPTTVGISCGELTVNGNESVSVTVNTESASDLDNSSDRYRIGYVMTADFQHDGYYQSNSCNKPADMRYYFLPTKIPGSLLVFRNVSMTSEYAFTGIPESLPAQISASTAATRFTVERPELLENLRDGRLTVYVLDTESGEVLNAAVIPLAQDISGVDDVVSDTQGASLLTSARGTLRIAAESEWSLAIYDLQGRLCRTESGRGPAEIAASLPAGIYAARLSADKANASVKLVIR